MVLACTDRGQRDRVRNARDYNWSSMVNMHRHGVVGKICRLKLMNHFADVDVLVRSVVDRGCNFIIEGCFLDLDSEKDSGKWYTFQIAFIKAYDTAEITFTPSLFYDTSFPDSQKYIDYRHNNLTPSA